MDIKEIINIENINVNLEARTKMEVFTKLAEMFYKNNVIDNIEEYVQAVLKREKEFSTGIGFGIAIPHAKCKAVKKATVGIAKLVNKLEYDSIDGELVEIIFIIAVPEEANNEHIKILSTLSRKFIHESFRENLKKAKTSEDIIKIFD